MKCEIECTKHAGARAIRWIVAQSTKWRRSWPHAWCSRRKNEGSSVGQQGPIFHIGTLKPPCLLRGSLEEEASLWTTANVNALVTTVFER